MRKRGHTVTLIGFCLPISTVTEVRAIAIRSRLKNSDVGRDFFQECWGPYLDRHPELKALALQGIPEPEPEKLEVAA